MPQHDSHTPAAGNRLRQDIETLMYAASRRDSRIIGFTSAEEKAGVSLATEMAAIAATGAGLRTLLIDFSGAADAATDGWIAGKNEPFSFIAPASPGYSRLLAVNSAAARGAFSNTQLLRSDFAQLLGQYARIIADLPPVLASDNRLNPLAPALACDEVCLVALIGQTSRDGLAHAAKQLKAGGVNLPGVVLNARDADTPGQALSNLACKLRRVAPSLARRLDAFAQRSPLLN